MLLAVAHSISTGDEEEKCYCLGPTAASLSALLAFSLSLHTSFTAYSLSFCGKSVSVCESVCVRKRSLLQSF